MALIPYVDAKSAPDEVRELLDVLPDLRVFQMVAHAPTLFGPWLGLGGAILAALELDPVLRELAILQVACTVGCEYERMQHGAIAAGVGATSEQVALLATAIENRDQDATDRAFTPVQRAVISFTDRVPAATGLRSKSSPPSGPICQIAVSWSSCSSSAITSGSLCWPRRSVSISTNPRRWQSLTSLQAPRATDDDHGLHARD